MPRKKISQLTEATVVNDEDYIPIVQGGVTKRAAKSLIGGGNGNGAGTEHLAALRALVGTTDKETTTLLGSNAAGDDAGDVFYWDAASTDADDDGLTVKPTAVSGAGRWKRVHDGTHRNAKWFGAKGDGSTDDTTAIANAIASCFDVSPHVDLVLPGGTYCVSSMITTPVSSPGWKIRAAGSYLGIGVKLKATAAIDSIMYFSHHAVVEGVTFDANSMAKHGMTVLHGTLARFVDCNFVNALYDGASILEGDAPIFENCSAIGNGIVLCSSAGVESQYAYISGNSGHTQTQVVQSSTSQAITLTVDADQHTVTASAASGTFDFTTLGIRYGDILRLNGGATGSPDATSRFFQVTEVLNPTTIMIAGNRRLATAGAYTDWAISRGDGIRSAGGTANNSQHIFRGGIYQFNAGSGIAIPGAGVDQTGGAPNFIFGLSVDGVDPQYNGGAGILVGQATCDVTPAPLVGITYAVTNGSPTVTASSSVAGLISPGAHFVFQSQNNLSYVVQSVVGATITLTATYTGSTDAATTITVDNIGCSSTGISIRNHYGENSAAGAFVLSNCYSGEIDGTFGGTFASANPDILTDSANIRVLPSEFNAAGVRGVGGFNSRSVSEEIALGSYFSSVPQASIQNYRTGWQQQPNGNPAASDSFDATRSYQRITLTADTVMTSAPTINAPSVSNTSTNYSEILFIQNGPESTGTLTLQDASVLPGSQLSLRTPTVVLPPGAWVVVMWDYNTTAWEEVCRSPLSGVGTQAMADANQTPTAKIYSREAIRTTGAITANRDLTLPALTDATARKWHIINDCTGAFGVVVKMSGGGTSVTVGNGKRAIVWLDAAGVTRMTADV